MLFTLLIGVGLLLGTVLVYGMATALTLHLLVRLVRRRLRGHCSQARRTGISELSRAGRSHSL